MDKTQKIIETLNEIEATPEGSKIQMKDRQYLFQIIGKATSTDLLDFPKDLLPELIEQVTTHLEWLANGKY